MQWLSEREDQFTMRTTTTRSCPSRWSQLYGPYSAIVNTSTFKPSKSKSFLIISSITFLRLPLSLAIG